MNDDRFEIQQLAIRYCHYADTKRFDDQADLFVRRVGRDRNRVWPLRGTPYHSRLLAGTCGWPRGLRAAPPSTI